MNERGVQANASRARAKDGHRAHREIRNRLRGDRGERLEGLDGVGQTPTVEERGTR